MLLVEYLREVVGSPRTGGASDSQLLERFVACRDEAAFEQLMWRHGAMVLAVCRRVLGRHHDAEDAFQATFLVLAHAARSLERREALAGWLYRVAYRTALRARARRWRSGPPLDGDIVDPTCPHTSDWHDLRPVLDEEVNRLPVRYRIPFVLCCLEGRTNEEAARQLGCAKGTVRSRLSRARALLRDRLTRRGVMLAAGALVASPAAPAWANPPAPLVQATLQAAKPITINRAVTAGVVSPQVAALAKGVLQVMLMIRLVRIAVIALFGLGLLGGGFGIICRAAWAEKPAQSQANDSQSRAKIPDKSKSDQAPNGKKEQGPSVRGVVASADAGKGTVTVNVVTKPESKQVEQKTFTVAQDTTVILEETFDKTVSPPVGKLADLTPGTIVTLEFSADGKAVVRIAARGPGITGYVKAVSTADRRLTVGVKQKDGPQDITVALVERAKVLLSDGLNKQDPPTEGKLVDLAEGTPVHVQLSVDRKRALDVRVQGVTLHGYLKSYDTANNTLIISTKGENGEEDRTLTAVKNAQLIDLTPGAPVTVRLSVFDQQKVAYARGDKGK